MQRASAAVQAMLRKTPTGVMAIVSHGNRSALLLTHGDQPRGFSPGESMTTPDVWCLHLGETGTRLWQTDRRP
jgi:hypothetical protein